MWKCRRHEKTCDGKVQLKYPGGVYHVPETVFEELEEGIIVPEEDRYFPHRETFDFECYFDKEKAQELGNTEKLTWQSAHVPLSVIVCSKSLVIKRLNVSCQRDIQTYFLKSLFST